MSAGLVRYEVVDGIGIVSFNRPNRHNAIDDDAYRWGLVDWVVEPAELDHRALEVCRTLAAAPPIAAAMAKQLVDLHWGEVIRRGMREELLAQTALFAGAEHREAKAAALAAIRTRRAR